MKTKMRNQLAFVVFFALLLTFGFYTDAAAVCSESFTPIYTVQGNGPVSPIVGTEVEIEGVVVGDFQNNSERIMAT